MSMLLVATVQFAKPAQIAAITPARTESFELTMNTGLKGGHPFRGEFPTVAHRLLSLTVGEISLI